MIQEVTNDCREPQPMVQGQTNFNLTQLPAGELVSLLPRLYQKRARLLQEIEAVRKAIADIENDESLQKLIRAAAAVQ